MRSVFIGLAVFFALSTAQAAEWLFVLTASYDDAAAFVDRSTARREGSKVTVWIQRQFRSVDANGWLTTKNRIQMDCSANSFDILNVLGLNAAGKVIHSSDQTIHQVVVPDSYGDDIRSAICAPGFPASPNRSVFLPLRDKSIQEYAATLFLKLDSAGAPR